MSYYIRYNELRPGDVLVYDETPDVELVVEAGTHHVGTVCLTSNRPRVSWSGTDEDCMDPIYTQRATIIRREP